MSDLSPCNTQIAYFTTYLNIVRFLDVICPMQVMGNKVIVNFHIKLIVICVTQPSKTVFNTSDEFGASVNVDPFIRYVFPLI